MVRISGGSLRGRVLETPGDDRVRPTTGQVREAVFSMLGERVAGAWVLDLFAGSGVMGLEALSRGARGVVGVERDARTADMIRRNVRLCGMESRHEVVVAAVEGPGLGEAVRQAVLRRFGSFSPFGLVLLDPPYGQGLVPVALEGLAGGLLLAPEALAVAEHEAGGEGKAGSLAWQPLQNRRYGDTRITFWQWRSNQATHA